MLFLVGNIKGIHAKIFVPYREQQLFPVGNNK